MKYRKVIYLLVFLFCRTENRAVAQSSRDSLIQSVQQLQSTTGDAYFTLLEKIIDISTRVKPLPAIPEGAREKHVMALSLREDANKEEDFDRPLSLLREARTLAPWWPEVHKEIGITFEMAGAYNAKAYDNAIYNFNKFLLTKPSEEDARKVQDEIYLVKAKKEKVIQKQNEVEAAEQVKLSSLVGTWISKEPLSTPYGLEYEVITFSKVGLKYQMTLQYQYSDPGHNSNPVTRPFLFEGTDTRIETNKYFFGEPELRIKTVFTLSFDGKKMTHTNTEYTSDWRNVKYPPSERYFVRKD